MGDNEMRSFVLIVVSLLFFTNCRNQIVENYIYKEAKTLLQENDTNSIIDLSSINNFSWDTMYYFSTGSSYDEILTTLPSWVPYEEFDCKLYFYEKHRLVYHESWPVYTNRINNICFISDSTRFKAHRTKAKFKISITNNKTIFLYPLLNSNFPQKEK